MEYFYVAIVLATLVFLWVFGWAMVYYGVCGVCRIAEHAQKLLTSLKLK